VIVIVGSPGQVGKRGYLSSALEDVEAVRKFAFDHKFDEIIELYGEQATKNAVNKIFSAQNLRCLEYRDMGHAGKYLVFIYYSGHGSIKNGTTRARLSDCADYPLELKIAKFTNENAQNSFILSVIDACRKVDDILEPDELIKGESDFNYAYYGDYKSGDSNSVMVFSCEPTRPTLVKDRVTHALFEFLMKKENDNGNLVFPDCLMHFNHKGQTRTVISCS